MSVPRSSSELHWWRPHLPQSECLLWGKTQSDPWWSEAAAWWSGEGEKTKLPQWLSHDNTSTQWERGKESERTGKKKSVKEYNKIHKYSSAVTHWFVLSATVEFISTSHEKKDYFLMIWYKASKSEKPHTSPVPTSLKNIYIENPGVMRRKIDLNQETSSPDALNQFSLFIIMHVMFLLNIWDSFFYSFGIL